MGDGTGDGRPAAEDSPRQRRSLLRRRRRANSADGPRTKRVEVKLTEAEHGQLAAMAAEQGSTIQRLLVERATAPDSGETPSERRAVLTELFALHRLLANIANNINQYARAANVDGQAVDGMDAAIDAARRTSERIDDTLDGLAS